jgi:hypothetical protein
MSSFRIVQFEGKPELPCSSPDDLDRLLHSLNKSGFAVPTLVNVYEDVDRIAIVGLGAENSTVQLVDKVHGETHRSTVLSNQAGDSVEFSYQGEATFVPARFLIPVELAVRAVVTWLSECRLSQDVSWLSAPCPPEVGGRKGQY